MRRETGEEMVRAQMQSAHDAQERFATFSFAVEGVAEQRVEDLGRAAGVEEEEQEEGDVGAELSEEGGRGRRRILGRLGGIHCRLLIEHLCGQLEHANHDQRPDRLDEQCVHEVDTAEQAIEREERRHWPRAAKAAVRVE